MQVSAISSGASLAGSLISSAGSVMADVGIGSSGASTTMMTGLNKLASVMDDYSSAEILMAMMLMMASCDDDDSTSKGGAALGFLAGLALAGGLGGFGEINQTVSWSASSVNGTPFEGGIGGQIDLLA